MWRLSVVLAVAATALACHELRVRREVRSLSAAEWARVAAVWSAMQRQGVFDRISYIHTTYFPFIHDLAQFLPWHRWLIFEFESIMRQIDPDVVLPYWASHLSLSL